MTQSIEAPDEQDIDRIARQLVHAQQMVREATGDDLVGTVEDFALIQRVIDGNAVEPGATYSLQALGIALGKVFVENNPGYDWWMVEDDYGRDPAIRYEQTTLLSFPQTMISKRIEDGTPVDVYDLYLALVADMERLRAQHYRST